MTQQPIYKKRGYTSDNGNPSSQALSGAHQRQEVLYQGNQDLGTGLFAIEIFLTATRDLIISA